MGTTYSLSRRLLITLGLCLLTTILIKTGAFNDPERDNRSKSKNTSSAVISSDTKFRRKGTIISKTRKRKKRGNLAHKTHRRGHFVDGKRNAVDAKVNSAIQEDFEDDMATVYDSDLLDDDLEEDYPDEGETPFAGIDNPIFELSEEDIKHKQREEFVALLEEVLGQTDLSESQIIEVFDLALSASEEELEEIVKEIGYQEEIFQLIDQAGIADEDPIVNYQDIQDLLFY